MLALSSRTIRRLGVTALAAAACFILGGCKNEKTANQLTSLQAENQELRARLDQQQAQLDSCEADKRNIQAQMSTWNPGTGGGGTGKASRSSSEVITVAGDALFASGSATIRKEAQGQLDRIANRLNGEYAGHPIKVVGHTDSDPLKKTKAKWGSNEGLSQARAQAVADYLSGKGVSAGRMTVEGKGASQPKGTKQASRRVEIIVLAMN